MSLYDAFRPLRRRRRPPVEILPGPDNRQRHFNGESRLYLIALLMHRP